ncbi:hypothetical protein J6590_023601 [Homalodisca vitripennis]|nr:hypothetical protein J6590_023601 [Homalodisca vitripennis]
MLFSLPEPADYLIEANHRGQVRARERERGSTLHGITWSIYTGHRDTRDYSAVTHRLIGIFPTNGGHHSGEARLCLTVAARPISGPDTVIVIVG